MSTKKEEVYIVKKLDVWRMITLQELLENEWFCSGLLVGINLCQQILLTAHDRNEPMMIDGEPYYILNGNELLQQMIDTVCQ